MSGRDHEPIAAFFPSIDRNLMRDLDRHLRNAAPLPPEAPFEPAAPEHGLDADMERPDALPVDGHAVRPSTADILTAVEQAASTMTHMTQRIQELEARQSELERTNEQLKAKLTELLEMHQVAESAARGQHERADRAEQIAAHHLSRAQMLEADLETALGDLTRVADAITGTLGASGVHRRG